MSSHREAPEISKDPVADSTDLYAFVSPDAPDTVTLIANYIPLQSPAAARTSSSSVTTCSTRSTSTTTATATPTSRTSSGSRPRSASAARSSTTSGPITALDSQDWNRRQTYSVTRIDWKGTWQPDRRCSTGVPCPPCNIGPLSTPNYAALANAAIRPLAGGGHVFAGQRREGFYVDLGSVFDLGNLRPFQQLHAQFGLNIPELTRPAPGVNATKAVNVHSIALQLPKSSCSRAACAGHRCDEPALRDRRLDHGEPAEGARARRDGIAERSRVRSSRCRASATRCSTKCSCPMEHKDYWNAQAPADDQQFADGRRVPRAREAPPRAVSGRVPEPRRAQRVEEAAWRSARDPAHRHPRRGRSPGSRTSPGRRRPTCCDSTSRSRRSRTGRATSVCSAATSPASRTAGACSTTCSRSSCARSRASPTRWSTRRSRPTARPPRSPTGSPRTSSTRPRRAP